MTNTKKPWFTDDDILKFWQTNDDQKTRPFDKYKFGKRLKAARKRALLTQEELADIIGVDKITLSNYETARRKDVNPSIETVYKIAATLKVSIDWLCGFSTYADIPDITEEIYRELYLRMAMDLMSRAERNKKCTRNKRYYKIPRKSPIYHLKQKLDNLEYLYETREVSKDYYREKQNEIWSEYQTITLEDFLNYTFNEREYIKYLEKKNAGTLTYSDEMPSDEDLPF